MKIPFLQLEIIPYLGDAIGSVFSFLGEQISNVIWDTMLQWFCAVIEAAGIKDVRAKSMRSNNPINVVAATFAGLCGLVSAESAPRSSILPKT